MPLARRHLLRAAAVWPSGRRLASCPCPPRVRFRVGPPPQKRRPSWSVTSPTIGTPFGAAPLALGGRLFIVVVVVVREEVVPGSLPSSAIFACACVVRVVSGRPRVRRGGYVAPPPRRRVCVRARASMLQRARILSRGGGRQVFWCSQLSDSCVSLQRKARFARLYGSIYERVDSGHRQRAVNWRAFCLWRASSFS